ncbi:hypothetical protein H5410_002560 [Solanum commersonii]|uniref:Uncharacterized protein n=1 Tax=Solanum commersonii TaxID=4109 RepID=A0A9J6B2L2_SOLCO|nr:hypothetical protein H5410_002560 [Solanum commersonii]
MKKHNSRVPITYNWQCNCRIEEFQSCRGSNQQYDNSYNELFSQFKVARELRGKKRSPPPPDPNKILHVHLRVRQQQRPKGVAALSRTILSRRSRFIRQLRKLKI